MDDLYLQLGQLERTQLIHRQDDVELAYQFKHALAQEATYQSLLVKTRRDIHLRVALYYEQLYATAPDRYAPLLAHHYDGAGDAAKTFHYALVAGDAAARLYAHTEALAHYDHAQEMLRRLTNTPEKNVPLDAEVLRLYTNRGRVLELSSQFDRALENYSEMEMLGRAQQNSGLELAGLTARAILYSTYTPVMDRVEGKEHNARILARAREIDDRAAEARILWIMSLHAKYAVGEIALTIEYGERALELARDLGLQELNAFILNDLATPYAMTGQFDKSRAATQEAIGIWQELGNLAMLSDTVANLIPLDFYMGAIDKAKQAYAESFRLSQLTGSLWGQAYSQMRMGSVFAERGEYGEAFKVMQECLLTSARAGFNPPQTWTRAQYAWLLGEIGLYQEAVREAELAVAMIDQVPPFTTFVLIARMHVAVLVGDLATAENISQQPVFQAESSFKFDPGWVASRALAEAEFALARRDHARAIEKLDPAIRFFETRGLPTYLSDLLYLKGHLLDLQGDTRAALAVYDEAHRAAVAILSRRMLWKILQAQSEINERLGNAPLAAEQRTRAREVVAYICERLDSEAHVKAFMALTRVAC